MVVLIAPDGTSSKFHDSKIKKCRQAIGRFWKFLKYANASVKLKLRVAHSLIFSHLSYGYDIIGLTQPQLNQINSIHATVLRTILQLPKHTSYDAMLCITGETSLTTLLRVRRVANLHRIQHLPRSTQLRKLYEERSWHTGGLIIFSKYEDDKRGIQASIKLTSVASTEFENAMNDCPTQASRQLLKQVCCEIEQSERFHRLRLRHNELLEAIKSGQSIPYLEISSTRIATYAKWLTGATDTKCDSPDFKSSEDKACRLCNDDAEETRAHLLTNCTGTKKIREAYFKRIKEISADKLVELSTLPTHRQWIWMLGAGTIREENPDPINNNRIRRLEAGIQAGRSVSPVQDKKDESQCLDAYNEYLEILSELEPEHIRIYTDGSHCPETRATGYGMRIVHHSDGSERVIHEVSKGLGQATINEAELEAVHEGLYWLIHENRNLCRVYHYISSQTVNTQITQVQLQKSAQQTST